MISHKYKCIFIHIPRTAGTSIENWLVGNDYWNINSKNKHLITSQAKRVYAEYWDEYFKFTIVRNPWSRMVSCLRFKDYFNINVKNDILDISGYKEKWGYPIIVENDYRFSDMVLLKNNKHIKNQIYGNIIDEHIDYIGMYENLEEVITYLKDRLGINKDFNFHLEKSIKNKSYREFYNDKVKEEVYDIYKNDIIEYNYKF